MNIKAGPEQSTNNVWALLDSFTRIKFRCNWNKPNSHCQGASMFACLLKIRRIKGLINHMEFNFSWAVPLEYCTRNELVNRMHQLLVKISVDTIQFYAWTSFNFAKLQKSCFSIIQFSNLNSRKKIDDICLKKSYVTCKFKKKMKLFVVKKIDLFLVTIEFSDWEKIQ